jgi:hypothetical protein
MKLTVIVGQIVVIIQDSMEYKYYGMIGITSIIVLMVITEINA